MYVCERCNRKVREPRTLSYLLYEKEPIEPKGNKIVSQRRVCVFCYMEASPR